MTRPGSLIALCSAVALPEGGDVPEWVHLLPAGEIRTSDGRGPYFVKSMHTIAASLKDGVKLPIDECHSTDRAAPRGEPAPARGWIVALQARDNGLWGKVEWTGAGHELMADRAYRGISPAILHTRAGEVLGVLRASLVNTPNLTGLVALHSEENPGMDWKAKLIELLGLDGEADDEAIAAKLSALKEAADKPALVSEHSQQDSEAIVSLQSELADVTGKYNALSDRLARNDATAFVDGAIAAGRVGVKPLRDRYISMHMANPAEVEEIIGALPKLSGSVITGEPTEPAEGELTASQRQVIALMGIDEEAYKESLAASGKRKEAL